MFIYSIKFYIRYRKKNNNTEIQCLEIKAITYYLINKH